MDIAAPDGSPFTSLSGPMTSTAINSSAPGTSDFNTIDHTHLMSVYRVLGIFEGTVATGVLISINGTDRTVALGGGTAFTADLIELEVGPWLAIGAKNTIDLTPSGLGGILGHLRLTGYIQSTQLEEVADDVGSAIQIRFRRD
jgi:hypothetical protein